MIRSYEFQGKNVEGALQKASDELDIPAEKIKHEVVAYGSSGIFGLVGVKKAKIKVFVEKEKATSNGKKATGSQRSGHSEGIEEKERQRPAPVEPVLPDTSMVEYGCQALQQIADSVTSGATVDGSVEGGRLFFEVTGGESGVLIGKRGQTLEAMQYLLEKMINKKGTNRVRVIVDVQGYLEKRKNNLQQMAKRMAEKALRTKKPVTIGQMNAHDRRIIHIHLKDEIGVRTQSLGEGYYRKLMIFPKKQARTKRRSPNQKT